VQGCREGGTPTRSSSGGGLVGGGTCVVVRSLVDLPESGYRSSQTPVRRHADGRSGRYTNLAWHGAAADIDVALAVLALSEPPTDVTHEDRAATTGLLP